MMLLSEMATVGSSLTDLAPTWFLFNLTHLEQYTIVHLQYTERERGNGSTWQD